MRVLLIEDYVPLRKALVQGLEEAGFAVDATGDGQEGLWYANSGTHDVIVLDLMLPGLDGLSILRHLRSQNIQTHVLILTAKDTLADRVKGLDCGADDYLVKPFALEELLARVRALIRRRYESKSPRICIGDLDIDTGTKQVSRAGEMIGLTAREYALLEYLALRVGQTVSRSDIWEHVYDFRSEVQSNVVDVYIGYLRKKIDRPGWTRLIHTRRGQGYVLAKEGP
jgi:two-component system OmpR family response regulator